MPAATTPDDHILAARLATEAGRLLVDLRARHLAAAGGAGRAGVDGRRLGAEGDRLAHELIVGGLSAARPGDAVLSEEGPADPARLAVDRVWIVDPLDGTREYGELPRDDWAVHVALVVEGAPVAGAVALPAQGVTLATDRPPAPPPASGRPPRIVVSRSRPPAEAASIATALGGEVVALGSAGAKAMAVVRGDADVYPHAGGQYEWDSAAPVAVAVAAGLHASRLDGSPLTYNRPDPWLPDLLVCRPELAEAAVAAARGTGT
ncbi:MAG TPA: 3'(2'),5'-bisphosphate nucleotidase CysQ [Acidimicrobiales bacterium]|nr:3'(2'),5'-bisphosphate nucleotidase CysQ [Acidimicrobiales bacterium]